MREPGRCPRRWLGTLTITLGGLIAWSGCALARPSLGELLDAGATRVSAAEFRRDIVARMVRGPMETGLEMYVFYDEGGGVEGQSWPPRLGSSIAWSAEIVGTWRVDDDGRICKVISLSGATIRARFSERCRYWFKLNDRYYAADSIGDRDVELLRREVHPVVGQTTVAGTRIPW